MTMFSFLVSGLALLVAMLAGVALASPVTPGPVTPGPVNPGANDAPPVRRAADHDCRAQPQ
jgi:hypothetical protein